MDNHMIAENSMPFFFFWCVCVILQLDWNSYNENCIFFKWMIQNKTDIWSLSRRVFLRDYSKHVLKQKHFTLKEESNYSRYVRWSFLSVCESQRFNWRETFVCCYSITETTLCTMEVLKEDLHNHNVIPSLCSAFVEENYIHLNSSWEIKSTV